LESNRKEARRLLKTELDNLLNGEYSMENIKRLKMKEKERVKSRATYKKYKNGESEGEDERESEGIKKGE
jgi:hypothetical protein